MKIRAATITDKPAWLAVRRRQRPALGDQQHEQDWKQLLEQRNQRMALLCVDEHGASLGMIEVSRRAQSEGLGSGPIAYVDTLHVEPGQARELAAERLADAAAAWAQARGCRVLASDTSIDNQWEQKLHHALGFEEVARKVVYRRVLARPTVASAPLAAVPAVGVPTPSAAQAAEIDQGAHTQSPAWWPGWVRAVIIVLGILAFYFTNIFSGNMFVGVVLPIVDVLFVIYLLMLFVSMKYQRKTDSSDRHIELFQASNDNE